MRAYCSTTYCAYGMVPVCHCSPQSSHGTYLIWSTGEVPSTANCYHVPCVWVCLVVSCPLHTMLRGSVLEHRSLMNIEPRQNYVSPGVRRAKSIRFLLPIIKITLFCAFSWKVVCKLWLSHWLFQMLQFGTGKMHCLLKEQFKNCLKYLPRRRRSRGFGDMLHL